MDKTDGDCDSTIYVPNEKRCTRSNGMWRCYKVSKSGGKGFCEFHSRKKMMRQHERDSSISSRKGAVAALEVHESRVNRLLDGEKGDLVMKGGQEGGKGVNFRDTEGFATERSCELSEKGIVNGGSGENEDGTPEKRFARKCRKAVKFMEDSEGEGGDVRIRSENGRRLDKGSESANLDTETGHENGVFDEEDILIVEREHPIRRVTKAKAFELEAIAGMLSLASKDSDDVKPKKKRRRGGRKNGQNKSSKDDDSAMEGSSKRRPSVLKQPDQPSSDEKNSKEQEELTMCHQCQRNDKGRVIGCRNCPAKRICIPCLKWYPNLSEEDIAELCPSCRGICNCKRCLRMEGPIQKIKKLELKISKEETVDHFKYLVQSVFPYRKQFYEEQMNENMTDAKIQVDDDQPFRSDDDQPFRSDDDRSFTSNDDDKPVIKRAKIGNEKAEESHKEKTEVVKPKNWLGAGKSRKRVVLKEDFGTTSQTQSHTKSSHSATPIPELIPSSPLKIPHAQPPIPPPKNDVPSASNPLNIKLSTSNINHSPIIIPVFSNIVVSDDKFDTLKFSDDESSSREASIEDIPPVFVMNELEDARCIVTSYAKQSLHSIIDDLPILMNALRVLKAASTTSKESKNLDDILEEAPEAVCRLKTSTRVLEQLKATLLDYEVKKFEVRLEENAIRHEKDEHIQMNAKAQQLINSIRSKEEELVKLREEASSLPDMVRASDAILARYIEWRGEKSKLKAMSKRAHKAAESKKSIDAEIDSIVEGWTKFINNRF